MLTFRNTICSIFREFEFYMTKFRNTICSIFRDLNFICRCFGTLCLFHIPTSEFYMPTFQNTLSSFFRASEFYTPTFRSTLFVPSSWQLNFTYRSFGILCLFHFPGVWILYADVSEHSIRSNFPASEFYKPTFRNTLSDPSSRHLNFVCWRFGTLFSIFIGCLSTPPMKMEQSVSKRHHIKFRRRGMAQN
jgi:hypothetical protein